MPSWVSYVGAIVTLIGLLAGAAREWYGLKERVLTLELKDRYNHGLYAVPPEGGK